MNTTNAIKGIQEYFESKIDKRMFNDNSNFDIDLQFGKVYEQALALILQDTKIEVKTERDTWKKTGNIAIELYNHNKKAPSGLSVTKADYWATILVADYKIQGIQILPVKSLKVRNYP